MAYTIERSMRGVLKCITEIVIRLYSEYEMVKKKGCLVQCFDRTVVQLSWYPRERDRKSYDEVVSGESE